jgi:PKD repeat protein
VHRAVWVSAAIVVVLVMMFAVPPPSSVSLHGPRALPPSATPALDRSAAGVARAPESARPAVSQFEIAGMTPTIVNFCWPEWSADQPGETFGWYAVMVLVPGAGGWNQEFNVTSLGETCVGNWGSSVGEYDNWGWSLWTWFWTNGVYIAEESNGVDTFQPAVATLSVQELNDTTVQLSWDNNAQYSANVTFGYYEVYEAVNGGPSASIGTFTSPTMLSTEVTGLSPATSYSFQVYTRDLLDGYSVIWGGSYSNSVAYTTPGPLSASIGATPSSGASPLTVAFSPSASGGTPPYGFSWDFGDGTPRNFSQNPTHTYLSAGLYTAVVEVTDSQGATTHASVVVNVTAAAPGGGGNGPTLGFPSEGTVALVAGVVAVVAIAGVLFLLHGRRRPVAVLSPGPTGSDSPPRAT